MQVQLAVAPREGQVPRRQTEQRPRVADRRKGMRCDTGLTWLLVKLTVT